MREGKTLISVGLLFLVAWNTLIFFGPEPTVTTTDYLNFQETIYIYSAYRVQDDEIRIAIVKSHLSNQQILYSFNGSSELKLLELECQRDGECPALYTPLCILSGFVGTIKDSRLSNNQVDSILLITDRNNVTVQVKDVRRSTVGKRKHELGVCLQPVFMHADWAQFIQFFEYWINEGATKFYIYRESYTNEVKRVIDFYIANSRVDIELIEWSKLPASNTNSDPNFYWYRLEVFMAIFDCMHRARWKVHYVAQLDLDEIVYITADKSLLSYLHWLEFKHPAMASVNFMSRRVRVPTYWDRITSPLNLNFSPFLEAELEIEVFKRPLYMKNIYIPERVKRFDIHFQREPEIISSNLNLSYVHLNAYMHHGLVLHFRRTDSIFSWAGSTYSKELEGLANRLERNYIRRLHSDRTGIFKVDKWNNIALKLVSSIEKCRQEQHKLRDTRCYSLSNCESIIYEQFSNESLTWYSANNSWIFLN